MKLRILLITGTLLLTSPLRAQVSLYPEWVEGFSGVMKPGQEAVYYNPANQPDWIGGTGSLEQRTQRIESYIRDALDTWALEGTRLHGRLRYAGRTDIPCDRARLVPGMHILCWHPPENTGTNDSIGAIKSAEQSPSEFTAGSYATIEAVTNNYIRKGDTFTVETTRHDDSVVQRRILHAVGHLLGLGNQSIAMNGYLLSAESIMAAAAISPLAGETYERLDGLQDLDREAIRYLYAPIDESCALEILPDADGYLLQVPYVWVGQLLHSATLRFGADGRFHVIESRLADVRHAKARVCNFWFDPASQTVSLPFVWFKFPKETSRQLFSMELQQTAPLAFDFTYEPIR